MINALIGIGFVVGWTIVIWILIIVHDRISHPKPKPESKVIYNPANGEPIGFDFNHKDWDAPQWEAPEWTFDGPYMRSFSQSQPQKPLVLNTILTHNEIRIMNQQHILAEINSGGMMILPDGINVLELPVRRHEDEWLNTHCPTCNALKHQYEQPKYEDEIILRNTTSEPVRIYTGALDLYKLEYDTYKRTDILKVDPPKFKADWIESKLNASDNYKVFGYKMS